VSVLWRGLELHPETPPDGRIVHASNPYIAIARENATRLAQKLGLKLIFPNRISKSRFALEGAEFARDNNQFDKYHEAVFHAYFIEGKEIGDLDVLADLAETCELDKENFIEAIERKYYVKRVNVSMEEAKRLFICALPTFIIGKKQLIGVQPFETFTNVVKQIL
jgi:predicted DsbA family dithiol-disulfide isomerase